MSSLSLHGSHNIARFATRSTIRSQHLSTTSSSHPKFPLSSVTPCLPSSSSAPKITRRNPFSTSAPACSRNNSRRRDFHFHWNPQQQQSHLKTTDGTSDPAPANTYPRASSLARPYRFHIAASWAGKPESARGKRIVQVPFPPESVIGRWRDQTLNGAKNKRRMFNSDAGEDFFFIQEGVAFGVADGVGGWVDSGVDPSLFSQSLMYHAHRYCRNAWAGEPEVDPTLDYEEREQVEGWELTPYACLDLAYGGVLREKFVEAGSSTACLLSLNASSGLLRSANLGDSGFLIIRSSNVIHKNPIQSHYFNCPKQLTKLPAKDAKKFSRACIDSPSEAETYSTKLRDGDIVVAYTDGLSDNIYASEMVTICSLVARQGGSEDQQVQMMADRMVEFGRQSMMSHDKVTPFEREAARQGMFFRGGKVDDVTVIVALVRETH
ncbi:Protein phosphatase 2C 7 [Marasmius crinis-equi]|uniref:Protein phosphatase n=1 Tax=Marasmius crinis-equi TaxID=585013 RepID=A0ABR3G1X5_9AGAR